MSKSASWATVTLPGCIGDSYSVILICIILLYPVSILHLVHNIQEFIQHSNSPEHPAIQIFQKMYNLVYILKFRGTVQLRFDKF